MIMNYVCSLLKSHWQKQQQRVDGKRNVEKPPAACGVPPTEGRGMLRRQRGTSSPRLSKAAAPAAAAAAASCIASPRSFDLSQQRRHPAAMDPHMQRRTTAFSYILSARAL